ncbi:TetR/AcrR family transcriptional regulator [Nannocystis radixulma]|uniref:TetR/AcrR family transcriptional regulator n=1 Tax=Nannocystis radixulma TaxID=2995305 RepID=A0ABT5B4C0_9BACT|nr:TetR/AcrR family transcriptional regulator [Nannocystis radixulma]MDC0668318.1 TetR/AcrR family transcriptional regulator [Nannocystis radixulma]
MTVRTEQKERTRQDILASANRLLRERGIAGASVAEVMKGAGLTVGGFYAHFESKEALVAASLRESLRELWSGLVAAAGKLRGVEAVSFVVRRYLSRSHRDHPCEGCPLPAVVADVAQAGEPVRDALALELGDYAEALGECIADDSPASRQRALALIALMYGGLSLSRALKGTPTSEELLKACRDFARQAFTND